MNTAPVNSIERAGVNVRCLYCGSGTVWWHCVCAPAQEVRDGKRLRPRIMERQGRQIVVVDDEAAAFNALGLERYRPLAPEIAAAADVATEELVSNVVTMDRKEYRREWMRRWREAEAKKRGGS